MENTRQCVRCSIEYVPQKDTVENYFCSDCVQDRIKRMRKIAPEMYRLICISKIAQEKAIMALPNDNRGILESHILLTIKDVMSFIEHVETK